MKIAFTIIKHGFERISRTQCVIINKMHLIVVLFNLKPQRINKTKILVITINNKNTQTKKKGKQERKSFILY